MNKKRRHYLVDKDTQLRYIALAIIPLVLLLWGLYYLMYYSMMSKLLIPEAIITALLPAMKTVNSITLLSVPVFLFIIFRLCLIYSNRIVGPIPRLKSELDRVVAGECSLRLRVRQKDALDSLVGKINLVLDKLEQEKRQ